MERIEVLVAAMNAEARKVYHDLMLTTDAVIAIQSNRDVVEHHTMGARELTAVYSAERGVGRNRNQALARATGSICLLADDDIEYVEGYEETVVRAFAENAEADVLVFNVDDPQRSRFVITEKFRVHTWNFMRFGAVRIAFRLSVIRSNGITFHEGFGGGTSRSHGEDSIFLSDCLQKGLRIYAVPETLNRLTDVRESTWNYGYTEKYVRDQGALYRAMSKRLWPVFVLQDVARRACSRYKMSRWSALRHMIGGVRAYSREYRVQKRKNEA